MLWRFASIDWNEVRGPLALLTLTYPGAWPCNGRLVKRHHKAFYARWVRRWGGPQGAWKCEFQRRGAPHLHAYCGLPAEAAVLL